MIELDPVAIDQADGCVRTEGRDGELFEQVSPNLKIRVLLLLGLVCLRPPGYPFGWLAARSRLVARLGRLPLRIGELFRRPLQRRNNC